MTSRWRRIGVPALGALALLVVCIAIFWQGLARIAITQGLASMLGVKVSFGHLDVRPARLSASDVHVENDAGEPIADIGTLDLRYSLRDLLPGGSRAYGIAGFDVENAHVTVIRHKDGTFNVPIPKRGAGGPPPAPYVFDGRMRDVSIDVYDGAQGVPAARHLMVRNVHADLSVATNARSQYRAGFTYVEDGQSFPVDGTGNVDVSGGVGMQRWRAPQLPIARIVDFALNSPSFHMVGGSLENADVRAIALADQNGALAQHVSATARIDRARIAIGGLAKPLRNVNGELAVYGDGLLLQNVNATIADVPIHLGGGIFHLASPSFRLSVAGRGDLHQLRGVLSQTNALPLAGGALLNVMVEGSPSKPLTLIGLRSPRASYGSVPVEKPNGLIAFDGQEVDVIGFHATYAGIGLRSRGRLNLHPKPRAVEIVAGFDASAQAVPYAEAIVPGMPLHAAMLAAGDRMSRVDVRGTVAGVSRDKVLDAAFHVSSDLVGTVGPIQIEGPNQSLYAIAAVDRPRQGFEGYLDARNVHLSSVNASSSLGVPLPSLPAFAATLDGRVVGSLHGGQLKLAGAANLKNVLTSLGDATRVHVAFGRTADAPLVVAMNAGGIGALGAVASATLSYERGTIRLQDAAAASGGSYSDARGEIVDVTSGTPQYHLSANLHSADVASLAAMAQPKIAGLVEGTAEAELRVSGSGRSPVVDGVVRFPEGAVNGLAFHDLSIAVAGTMSSLVLRNGSVAVGSTDIAFDGSVGATAQRVSLFAPRADLQDFNDFFDPGDMLGGRGRVRLSVASAGGAVVATSGNVALQAAKVRSFDLGTADVVWHGTGRRIDTSLALRGESGRVSASGSVGLDGTVDLVAHARDVDLSRSLPMAGIVTPVSGIAQADISADGRYPNLDLGLNARVGKGSVGRIPVELFSVAATMHGGRGRLTQATLLAPNARVDGSGTFGLRPEDRLGLTFRATTADVAALAKTITGKTFDAAGSLDTTLRVAGTRTHPVLTDEFALQRGRYGRFDIPRAVGRVRIDDRDVVLSPTEIDLLHGRLLAEAALPIRLQPFHVDSTNRPVSGSLVVDDVEASNVAALLPTGTKVGGRVDGRITLGGTVYSPHFGGAVNLAAGSFAGPQESVPITDAMAQLTFSGTSVSLQEAQVKVGGTIEADGRASIPDLRDARFASLALNLHARSARIDMPQYIKGRIDGDVRLTRAPASRPLVDGTVAISSARIPLMALYNPGTSSGAPTALPDLGLDLHVNVDRDVRVVSSNVDVGAQGSLRVMGSLTSPKAAGTFTSTGGTVSFLRDFRIQQATVTFDPSSGIVPTVDATATTYVSNPSTNVALRVTGPATGMNIAFSSVPQYDREQILGLLVNAQSLGAVRGVASTGTPFSASSAISGLAAGQINSLFTRNLLEPLSVALGGTLGLQNLQITNDIQGGFGVNAVKTLGKNVDFVFAQTFSEPRRTAWTIQAHPNDATQYALTAYTSQNTTLFLYQPVLTQGITYGNISTIPLDTGTNGIDFKFARKFP